MVDSGDPQLATLVENQFHHPVESQPLSPQRLNRFLLKLAGVAHQSAPDTPLKDSQATRYQGHVLVVEDNQINQLVITSMLQEMGISCDICTSGEDALTKIMGGCRYDLVFMDIQMPGMDGYETTRRIRSQNFDKLVVCALSANAMRQDIELALDAGMNDYLTKPIEWPRLNELLGKYLEPIEVNASSA